MTDRQKPDAPPDAPAPDAPAPDAPALDVPALDVDVLELAADWQDQGFGVAIATVISTWGSAPRPVGSHLIVRGDGLFQGSVSGGCIEGAVAIEAAEIIASGKARVMEFGVSNADAWGVGLACGGRIRIFVQPLEK